jgi:rhodanese-related sulfurtransferase
MYANELSCDEARSILAEGAHLIDVRTPEEFARGALPAATNIPLHEVPTATGELLTSARPVVFYCRSGVRSAQAAAYLRRLGHEQAHNLGGIGRYLSCQ